MPCRRESNTVMRYSCLAGEHAKMLHDELVAWDERKVFEKKFTVSEMATERTNHP